MSIHAIVILLIYPFGVISDESPPWIFELLDASVWGYHYRI